MRTMLISLIAMTAGTYAQSPAPAAPSPKAEAAAPAGADMSPKASGDGSATQWTYKTKDGQMYEPPKERPASPAMDLSVYGRT